LFFVLEGDIEVSKQGRKLFLPAGVFIGEITFLLNTPASATVKVKSGARYVEWSREALSTLLNRYPALKTTLDARLSIDLATKVAAA
jgi:CRP-like cAMP-binding protein